MNSENISTAIGEIDEQIVSPAAERRAECYKEKKAGGNRGRKIWLSVASAAACLGIVGGIFAMSKESGILILPEPSSGNDGVFDTNGESGISDSVFAEMLAKAVYPEAAPYPDESQYFGVTGGFDDEAFDRVYEPWREQKSARRDASLSLSGLSAFYQSTVPAFLSGSGNENRVYSPISLYSALSMLAETTDGESREQILALLNTENIEALREQAKNLWAANYRNDGATTAILANSVWLNQGVNFVRKTVDRLAGDYYASSYRGDPASEEMNRLLRDWLNEQTGGLLEEAVKNTGLSPETVMALYSTVYFRAKWDQEFREQNNDEKIFHSVSGDVTAEFMNATNHNGAYYWGEDFGAYQLRFADGGGMWLILPDEDKTTDDVLASGEYLEMIESRFTNKIWENVKGLIVHYSVPKFDVSSDIGLNEGLEALGVTDIFDAATADFSPLAENSEELYVSTARHAARVVIDEQGCTAAAFTEMAICGAAMPPDEEMDFIVDRPFLFVITGDTGGILFAGTVNSL